MKTILIIDDELTIAETLRAILEEEGYRVVTAANGHEGLARVEEVQPDLVLCDIMLPLLDGRDLYRRLHNTPRYATLPFVLMSAGFRNPVEYDLGDVPFLPKPFELTALLDTVNRLIGAPPVAEARDSSAWSSQQHQ